MLYEYTAILDISFGAGFKDPAILRLLGAVLDAETRARFHAAHAVQPFAAKVYYYFVALVAPNVLCFTYPSPDNKYDKWRW